MAHVFIAYQHEDADFAENLIHRIQKEGYKTWVDNISLRVGADWRAEIDQAIKDAIALVVIVTPEAKASEYVTYEWAFAWGSGVKVIPVLLKSTPLHPRLGALQYLDFTDRIRPWDRLLRLLNNATHAPFSSQTPEHDTLTPFPSPLHKTKSAWLDRGKIFLGRNDNEEALESYKQAIFLDPNDASAYLGKSEALNKLDRYQEALKASEQVINLDPNIASAWNNKGYASEGLKQYNEALNAYDQAICLNSNYTDAKRNKGSLLRKLKRHNEALIIYKQALHINPNDTYAWKGQGDTLRELKRYTEALEAYDQAIRLNPRDTQIYKDRDKTLEDLDNYKKQSEKLDIFVSYSHKDKVLRDELANHMSTLRRQDIIRDWYDGDIIPGTKWDQQIFDHLKTAKIILILISSDFIASDFCYSIEMKQALDRHNNNEARVIPILLRPTDWEGAPFDKLQILPNQAKAVTRWNSPDDAFEDIVKGIKRVIRDLKENIEIS